VVLIVGKKNVKKLQKKLETDSCPACKRLGDATLAVKKIWLNNIGDIIFEGSCKDCGGELSLYFEATQFPGSFDQAMAIRELKIEVLKDFEVKK
jgi:hypothetical protein